MKNIYNYHPSISIMSIYRMRFTEGKVFWIRQEDIEQMETQISYTQGTTKVPK